MTAKTDPLKMDHAIALYQSGKSLRQAASEAGVSYSPLRRAIVARGIEFHPIRTPLPDAEIVEAYVAGESELDLARRYGIARSSIRLRLRDAGVEIRGISESQQIRYASTTSEERKKITAAANAAARGRVPTDAQLHAAAATREERLSNVSPAEHTMIGWLRDAGQEVVPQKAVGRYNIDAAVHPVAVEVLGGGWHLKKLIHAERTPYLFDQGWHLVFVWVDGKRRPLLRQAAEYVLAFLDEARRNPTGVREYRVIRGDGQEVSRGRADDDDFALVWSTHPRDTRGTRNKRAA